MKRLFSGVEITTNKMISVIFLLLFFKYCAQEAVILDGNIKHCIYNSSSDRVLKLTSTLWTVQNVHSKIDYTFCGGLSSKLGCKSNSVACMATKNVTKRLGTNFILREDGDLTLETINGDKCKLGKNYTLIIKFIQCSENIKVLNPRLKLYDDCVYHVEMMSPNCDVKCTVRLLGTVIDLRPLKNNYYTVISGNRQFRLSLCGREEYCQTPDNPDVNGCEIVNNKTIPLSTYSSQHITYNDKKNQISIQGQIKQQGKKASKKLELVLKCNWDTEAKNFHYVPVSTQGKLYTFEMESSFGCIKMSRSCILYDQFWMYNLSNVYNEHQEKWTVKNISTDLSLNICGPLNLKNKENRCSATLSQVCEINNGNYLNRGSILTGLKIESDIIRATMENGAQCKENLSLQYKTHIDLECDEQERGPTFHKFDHCDTYIRWKTPSACPLNNKASCAHLTPQYHNCTFNFAGKFFDLSPLTLRNKHYIIKNGTRNYLINVCGPIFDEDSPCTKDVSLALKHMDEFNVKKRLTSMGKMAGFSYINGNVVLETSSGSYCNGMDFRSEIHFKCSDTEGQPELVRQENCVLIFSWKSKHGCPINKVKQPEKCELKDVTTNKTFNFDRQTSVKTVVNNQIYIFDICLKNYTECNNKNENCEYLSLKNNILRTLNRKTYLQMDLPKTCDSVDDFNKTEFLLKCDKIMYNEHFNLIKKSNCTLTFEFISSQACSEESLEANTQTKIKELKLSGYSRNRKFLDCNITSQYTGYEFPLSNLQGINISLYTKCPDATYNNTNRRLKLFYLTNTSCKTSAEDFFYYEIILICSDGRATQSIEENPCYERHKYEQQEFCNFFHTSMTNHNPQHYSPTGIVIGVLVLILAIIAVVIGLKYKRKRFCMSYDIIYHKNGDL